MRRFAWVLVATSLSVTSASGCKEQAGGLARGKLERGGEAYLAQCAVCHGTEGQGNGPLAASIIAEHKAPPAVFDSVRVASLGRAGVLRALEGGSHRREGSTMPLWGPHLGREWMGRIADFVVRMPSMSEAARDARSQYLAVPKGAPRSGRTTYVLYCSGCHGPRGGGDGFFGPTLTLQPPRIRGDSLRAVGDEELSRFIAAGGQHAAKAPTMPGWLYTISPDDRAALVSYLRTLPGVPERN